jgi:hypothetical protein
LLADVSTGGSRESQSVRANGGVVSLLISGFDIFLRFTELFSVIAVIVGVSITASHQFRSVQAYAAVHTLHAISNGIHVSLLLFHPAIANPIVLCGTKPSNGVARKTAKPFVVAVVALFGCKSSGNARDDPASSNRSTKLRQLL